MKNDKNIVAVPTIEQSTEKLISVLLKSDSSEDVAFAMDLLLDTYQIIYDEYIQGYVNAEEEQAVTLFGDNIDNIFDALKRIKAEKAYGKVSINNFATLILQVVYFSEDESAIEIEARALRDFYRCIGSYLADREKKGDKFDSGQWQRMLSSAYFSLCRIPEKRIDAYYRNLSFIIFDYIYGLLRNRYYRLIEDSFTDGYVRILSLGSTHGFCEVRWECLSVFAVYGYLYYMSYYGKACGVDNEEIEGTQKLLYSNKTVASLKVFLRHCASVYSRYVTEDENCEKDVLFESTFRETLYGLLRQYEIYKKDFEAHRVYCDQAAREFYLFMLSYLSMEYWDESFLEQGLDINEYKSYFEEGSVQYLKDIFAFLIPMLELIEEEDEKPRRKSGHTSSENEEIVVNSKVSSDDEVNLSPKIDNLVDEWYKKEPYTKKAKEKAAHLYEYIFKWIDRKYVDEEMKRAGDEQNEYSSSVNVENLKQEIVNIVERGLKERYRPILGDNSIARNFAYEKEECDDINESETVISQRINLLTFDNLTSYMHLSDVQNICLREPVNRFADWISALLINHHKIQLCRKSEKFSSDNEYIKFLKDNIDIMVGSEWVLHDIDYKNLNAFKNETKDISKVFAFSDYGLLLKKDAICVCLKGVEVEIVQYSEEEILQKAEKVNDNKYIYEVSSGFKLEFEKDELIKYVRDKRKVIKVYADIEIAIYLDDIGLAMVR